MDTIYKAAHFIEGKINESHVKSIKDLKTNLQPGEVISRGYACFAPRQNLVPHVFKLPALLPDEVEIKVQYCSVCHTDLSMIRNEFNMTSYPFVPGHEAIGVITKLGDRVIEEQANKPEDSKLFVGKRVGVGFFKRSCHTCELCQRGEENICVKGEPVLAKDGANGGFSEYLHVDNQWVIPIPEGLSSEIAAPLLCAGITVYAPIKKYCKPGSKVGLIGFGGLGHLFVQFASKLGCEVYVFSKHEEKHSDALKLGGDHFIVYKNTDQLQDLTETLDFLIDTAYADLNWKAFLNILKPDGVLCFVGFPPHSISIPQFDLIFKQKKVVGSNVGPPSMIKEMLEFCDKNNIGAVYEQFSINDVQKVLDSFESGVYYRAVLKIEGEYDKIIEDKEITSG